MGPPEPRDWDAARYDRVSAPQQEWSRAVIERLGLDGGETVLDAGCGSGQVSAELLARLPRGRLIGVDASPSMIAAARDRLGPKVTLICSDLLELELDRAVDVVFSNAAFHWVGDHPRLFERLFAATRPGGRLEAQCGGAGNVASFVAVIGEVSDRDPYREHLGELPVPWNFAAPEETEERLAGAGWEAVSCGLERRPTRPEDPAAFVGAVGLGAHSETLPEELRERFVAEVVSELGPEPVLDYVRLNISARRPVG
jgi:trans-aconitate 2-methyltransferase